jgi:hypothetical protein
MLPVHRGKTLGLQRACRTSAMALTRTTSGAWKGCGLAVAMLLIAGLALLLPSYMLFLKTSDRQSAVQQAVARTSLQRSPQPAAMSQPADADDLAQTRPVSSFSGLGATSATTNLANSSLQSRPLRPAPRVANPWPQSFLQPERKYVPPQDTAHGDSQEFNAQSTQSDDGGSAATISKDPTPGRQHSALRSRFLDVKIQKTPAQWQQSFREQNIEGARDLDFRSKGKLKSWTGDFMAPGASRQQALCKIVLSLCCRPDICFQPVAAALTCACACGTSHHPVRCHSPPPPSPRLPGLLSEHMTCACRPAQVPWRRRSRHAPTRGSSS